MISNRPGKARDPFERRRVAIEFDPEQNRTHQSFRDECEIENILGQFGRTGVITHLNNVKPQYGEAPDISLHEAMVAQAEIRSYEETALDEPEASENDSDAPESTEPEKPAPAASKAAESAAPVESSGE